LGLRRLTGGDGLKSPLSVLKRPQAAILALIASAYTPVYPCRVSPRDMRQHPIGTGPFKFVEFKPNESFRLTRNPDYWKPGRPYLDGIECTIIPNRSTAILAFTAGKFDLTFPYEVTVPLMKDVKSQAPQAICELVPSNASTNLLVNREAPPFDNPDLRRALALALDRKSFMDILTEGQGDIGGAMLPPPAGVWGMPPEILATIPSYGPDVAKNRAAAREIMERLGYGPDKRLAIKVAARNIAGYRDPAIILIDQLKEIWIDSELDPIETANWFPKLARKDYQIGLNNTGSGVDDPDQQLFQNYGCGSERNYTGYCNAELEKRFVAQSETADRDKRRRLVWDIDKQLQEDSARPIIYHIRAATCIQPQVKGLTIMVNSQYMAGAWRTSGSTASAGAIWPLDDGNLPIAGIESSDFRR
jgi:peptide/nickel transport system substrate-binding protein